MLKTSLLEILRALSKEELKRFDEFVNSPYFNKKSTVTRLWEIIKKHAPEFNTENLDRKKVYSKLFPGKEFNYGVMKNLIYDLTQLIERFLAEESFAQDEFKKGFFLIDKLFTMDLKKLFSSKYKAFEEKLISSKSPELYRELAELKWLKYSVVDMAHKADNLLIYEISEFTIYNNLIDMFKLYNNLIADKMSLNIDNKFNLLENFLNSTNLNFILEHIKNNSPENFKIVGIYYSMYLALSNPDKEESFHNFKNVLLENDHLVSEIERMNLYTCLWNSIGENSAIKNKPYEFHEISKIVHRKNLFLNEMGYISVRKYSLGIRMASMVRDIEFIEMFMKTYLDKLIPSAKENMSLYSSVHLNFAKGEYGKALELVNKIDFDILSFKFELKNLQLMLFYELGDYESLMYALDSHKHFAANNPTISESTGENLIRFINYVNTLCKLKENPDKIKLGLLKEKVINDTLNTRDWLLEKITKLEKLTVKKLTR